MDQLGIEPVDRFLTSFLLPGHYLGEIECNLYDIAGCKEVGRKTAGASTNADHGRERALTLRQDHMGCEDQRLPIHPDLHFQCIVAVFGGDRVGPFRLSADLVVLDLRSNLHPSAAPVLEAGGSSATVGPGKRVGQCFHHGQLLKRRQGNLKRGNRIFGIIDQRYLPG